MNEIRDPVHGFISPSDHELRIISTPLFQRLRRIRQLAMEYLVYPGALHTRFDHSLGVYHVASLVAEKLLAKKGDDDKRRLVRLAALLHDVGHAPFSHVSEEILDRFAQGLAASGRDSVHEKVTADLIENSRDLRELLSPEERRDIVGLLRGTKLDITLMKQIVSGPLDADKMDYLLRDSHFCGVKYGIFDLDRLLNTITAYGDEPDKHIAVRHDGVNSLEQFVLAKYYMIKQVYFHKVRLLSDAMIQRGIVLGIERDEIVFLKNIFCYEASEKYFDNYLNYWDDKVLAQVLDLKEHGCAYEIFSRLYERRLFKRIFSRKLGDIKLTDEKMRDVLIDIKSKDNDKLRMRIEQEISLLLTCRKEYVILNCFQIRSVKEMASGSEGSILVVPDQGEPQDFENASMIFQSIDKSLKDVFLEVYAPIQFTDLKDKQTKLAQLGASISVILENEKGGKCENETPHSYAIKGFRG